MFEIELWKILPEVLGMLSDGASIELLSSAALSVYAFEVAFHNFSRPDIQRALKAATK